jgi:tetratricopeptide (TPR) repeat protein
LALALNQPQRASQAYQEALRLNPADWSAMAGLAGILVAQKRFPKAQRWLDRALVAGGPEAPIWETWGRLMQAQGDWSLAARYYREAVGADPSWWKPHYDLAEVALHAHRVREASRQLRSALAENPGSSQAWLLLQTLPGAFKRLPADSRSGGPERAG